MNTIISVQSSTDQEVHGDVARHPLLDTLARMEEIERENDGRNPNPLLPRLMHAFVQKVLPWLRLVSSC